MNFTRVNSATGTRRVGYIAISFQELHKILGAPKKLKAGSDSQYAWDFKIHDPVRNVDQVYSIYDNNLGPKDRAEDNKLWDVAGSRNGAHVYALKELFPNHELGEDFWHVYDKAYHGKGEQAALNDTQKRQIKALREKQKKERFNRKQMEKKSVEKVDQMQHKINDIKYSGKEKPAKKETEEKKMGTNAKYNAMARLKVTSNMRIDTNSKRMQDIAERVRSNLESFDNTRNDAYIIRSVQSIKKENLLGGLSPEQMKEGEFFHKSLGLNARLTGGANLSDGDYARFLVFCEAFKIDLADYEIEF